MRITGRANPEFERNLVLELTPQRLFMMPVTLGGIFFLIYLVTRNIGFAQPLASASAGIFSILVFGLGLRAVSESIASEVEARTWDFQKMSAIGAWKMAWGKLIGSAIFLWYGGLLCLLVYFSVYPRLENPPPLYATLTMFLGGGLMAHAAAFLMSLDAVLSGRKGGRLASLLISLVFITYSLNFLSHRAGFGAAPRYIEWFGITLNSWQVITATILAFLAWGLLGCYRALQVELAYRTSPNAWAAFTIFSMIYAAGFVPSGNSAAFPARTFTALMIGLVFTYWQLLTEKKNLVRLRKMAETLKEVQVGRVYALSPRWLVSLFISLGAALLFYFAAVSISLDGAQQVLSLFSRGPSQTLANNLTSLSLTGVSLIIFAVRDCALVLALAVMRRGSKSAEKAAAVYLLLLYLVAPLIFSTVGLGAINALFLPTLGGNVMSLVVVPALPMTAALAVLAAVWNRENARRLSDDGAAD